MKISRRDRKNKVLDKKRTAKDALDYCDGYAWSGRGRETSKF